MSGMEDQLGAILQDIGNCDRGQHNIDRHDLFIEQAADDAFFQQHAEGKCQDKGDHKAFSDTQEADP